jgi:hypothetical protein
MILQLNPPLENFKRVGLGAFVEYGSDSLRFDGMQKHLNGVRKHLS